MCTPPRGPTHTNNVGCRPFCIFEIEWALSLEKKIVLVHETDSRHGAFDFGAGGADTPPAILELLQTHESLPWRRRKYEQDTILQELVRLSGFVQANAAASADMPKSQLPEVGGGGGSTPASPALSSVPTSVPDIPEAFSPRAKDTGMVLDVLLNRTAEQVPKQKVLAHGMGGLGKTTVRVAIWAGMRVYLGRGGGGSSGSACRVLCTVLIF